MKTNLTAEPISLPQRVARRRAEQLRRYQELRLEGKLTGEAARMVGVSTTTLWDYEQRFNAKGLAGLVPLRVPGKCAPLPEVARECEEAVKVVAMRRVEVDGAPCVEFTARVRLVPARKGKTR